MAVGAGEPERGLRVLLVGDLLPAERGVGEALAARGLRVAAAPGPAEALHTLRRDGADVVVLALPLAQADPVAACAALTEGPEAPALLLADASAQAGTLEAALPEGRRPEAVLARPLDAAKLALAVAGCARSSRAAGEPAAAVSLAELLVGRKAARASEVLELRAAGVCTAIHLRHGDPIFAEGGSLQETLGRQLVRRGALGHDDYARVVARMTEGVVRHESLRLGEVLVELGLLAPAEVYDALALQVREKIVACFQWERFAYDVHESLDDSDELGIYQCPPTEALVLAGVRAHYGPARVQAALAPYAHAALALSAPLEALVPVFQPTAAEQRLLRAIDGRQTAEALAASGLLDPLHCGQLLAAFALAGALGFRTAAPRARSAAAAAPEAAPRPGAAHPAHDAAPTAPRLVPLPAKPTPEAPRAAARSAFDPLTQLRRRMGLAAGAAAGAKHGRLAAENAFNQGLRLLRESLLPGALREFRRAVELMPEEPEYRLLEAWLEYRSARAADARALAAAKVRACAERVLRASRTSARALGVLGQLALLEGDDDAAERSLRLALRYDAADVETQRALRLLEMRRRGKGG